MYVCDGRRAAFIHETMLERVGMTLICFSLCTTMAPLSWCGDGSERKRVYDVFAEPMFFLTRGNRFLAREERWGGDFLWRHANLLLQCGNYVNHNVEFAVLLSILLTSPMRRVLPTVGRCHDTCEAACSNGAENYLEITVFLESFAL